MIGLKNYINNDSKIYIAIAAVSIIVGLILGALIFGGSGHSDSSKSKEPLYWVAPMDPNYKRDKPGKSPMGMDLIPVYEEGGDTKEVGPGAIKINPNVVNNLGVRTVKAKREALVSEIRTVGYVQFDEGQLTHINPRVEGWIENLYVTASGDPVTKDQPLYSIYSPQLVNAQEELLLALKRESDRLIKGAENRLLSLQLSPKFIQKLKNERQVEKYVTFNAPKSGVLNSLNIRKGDFVKPGTKIMSIGILKDIWVEAEIYERQSHLVRKGLPVTMTLDFLPGKKWKGEVGYVYPALDEKTRTTRVRLRFDNTNFDLKPNMFAQVVIHSKSVEETIVIPREAVIRTGKQDRVVLDLGEGTFKSVEVQLGNLTDESAEILSGLKEGESIVSSAQFLLDSESSKTSDFKRMGFDQEQPPQSVWVASEILEMEQSSRKVKVTHDPIDQWGWPEMTMSFLVA